MNMGQMGMPPGMGGQGPNGQAQYYEYDEEYGDEGEQLDENGQPLPSPEQIKNIINAIPAFKYEEKKQPVTSPSRQGDKSSSQDKQDDTNTPDSCAICLDDLKTGQMVKALACSHKFHGKCINNWLKQKLLCPLCKEKIHLNNI